jgi:hypothetical protein
MNLAVPFKARLRVTKCFRRVATTEKNMYMFCPKCNELLTMINENAFCSQGNMYLSQHLSERLEVCFIKRTELPRELKFSHQVGGEWFCPGCGVEAIEENGSVDCPDCRLSLNEFIHELIERSPHNESVVATRQGSTQ